MTVLEWMESITFMELDAAEAAKSPLHHKCIFLVASPESGAQFLLAALGRLPGITAARVPTHLFSQGVARLFEYSIVGEGGAKPNGVAVLVQGGAFLSAVRLLTDMTLEAVRANGDTGRIAEYSPRHILQTDAIAAVYPDAHIVHLVRDPRQVVARLASTVRGRSAREAAEQWREDQESVSLAEGSAQLHLIRLEDLVADPATTLGKLSASLELDVTPSDIDAAAAALRFDDHWRSEPLLPYPVAMAEVLLGDRLEAYDYPVSGIHGRDHRVARFELAFHAALKGAGDYLGRGLKRVTRAAKRVQAEPTT